jgi:cyclophilin family peptidyl-prolyl cis-trans isomerase
MRSNGTRGAALVGMAGLRTCSAIAIAAFTASAPAADTASTSRLTTARVIAAAGPADWRTPDPANTIYLQIAAGRVVIELAPDFAPQHAENIRTLIREGYFDGLAIIRSQDNFVVQWGDAEGKRPLRSARSSVPPEFTVAKGLSLPFTRLPDADGYAPEAGFSGGFPAARDPRTGEAWLVHCYAMVGAGRANEVDSGTGAELYVVTGHAPRQLDRNIALVGRVVQGIELLSVLPRGTGALGFYEQPSQHVPIASVRMAADVPPAERANIEIMRTDTPTFAALVEARRNRQDEWYKVPAGYIDVCNVPIPVRAR